MPMFGRIMYVGRVVNFVLIIHRMEISPVIEYSQLFNIFRREIEE